MNVKATNKDMQRQATHSGSSFDDFLEEEGMRNEVESIAVKRVLAWQFEQEMEKQCKTKQGMARELRTSRSQLDRLLDPANTAVSLETLTRAANVLGKRLVFEIRDKVPVRKARIPSASKGKVSVNAESLRARSVRTSKAS
jgi:antitoxin HicB